MAAVGLSIVLSLFASGSFASDELLAMEVKAHGPSTIMRNARELPQMKLPEVAGTFEGCLDDGSRSGPSKELSELPCASQGLTECTCNRIKSNKTETTCCHSVCHVKNKDGSCVSSKCAADCVAPATSSALLAVDVQAHGSTIMRNARDLPQMKLPEAASTFVKLPEAAGTFEGCRDDGSRSGPSKELSDLPCASQGLTECTCNRIKSNKTETTCCNSVCIKKNKDGSCVSHKCAGGCVAPAS